VPYYLVESEIHSDELQNILQTYQVVIHSLSIIHTTHRQLPKKMRIFKNLLINCFVENKEYTSESQCY